MAVVGGRGIREDGVVPRLVKVLVAVAFVAFHVVLYVDAATADKIEVGAAVWLGTAVVAGFVVARWWAAALPAAVLVVALVLAVAGHGFPDGATELLRFAYQAALLALGVGIASGLSELRSPALARGA
jgi:hypothetical protein